VYATTNADGRFEFTSLSRGAGFLLAADCNDAIDRCRLRFAAIPTWWISI
jgi:hypothetical protein